MDHDVGGFLMLRYLPYMLVIALWIYAFVDCLGTPEQEVRGLPKVVWVLIILFFGEVLVGPLAWLIAGRRRGPVAAPGGGAPADRPRGGSFGQGGRYRRDGSDLHAEGAPGRRQWTAPDDNPEFLRSLGERNKQNRRNGTDRPSSEDE
jgi:Phospholipase_D-nuclease N-terminal